MASNIQLEGDALVAAVSATILHELTPETREKMITTAIAELLQKPRDSNGAVYRNLPSPLQMVFTDSVQRVATELVRTELEADQAFKGRVRELINEAIARAFDGEARERTVVKMSNAIAGALLDR